MKLIRYFALWSDKESLLIYRNQEHKKYWSKQVYSVLAQVEDVKLWRDTLWMCDFPVVVLIPTGRHLD